DQHGDGLGAAALDQHAPQQAEEPTLAELRIERRTGLGRARDAEEVVEERQRVARAAVADHARFDLRTGIAVGVARPDVAVRAHELPHELERDETPVRRTVPFVHRHAALAASLDELRAEPALAHPGLADDPDHGPGAAARALERTVENAHLGR